MAVAASSSSCFAGKASGVCFSQVRFPGGGGGVVMKFESASLSAGFLVSG